MMTLFNDLDETTTIIKEHLQTTYLDALTQNLMYLAGQEQSPIDDVNSLASLKKVYERFNEQTDDAEVIRQACQLAILKGLKEVKVEPNKQMTPDAIGFLVVFMVQLFIKSQQTIRLFDPVVGTGNLLMTVANGLRSNYTIDSFGIDNDDSLLELAASVSELIKQPAIFNHQDVLAAIDFEQMDVAIADLPIGYYPLDTRAKQYETHEASGHSFAHHLIIEQTMRQLKPGGIGVFLVPNVILESQQSKSLIRWLTQNVYLQALLGLPANLFKNEAGQKAILVLQKPGENIQQAKEILLGEFPNSTNQKAFNDYLNEIKQWYQKNI